MKFSEALTIMKEIYHGTFLAVGVKRPSWGGYWFWDGETIKMVTKDKIEMDIRETEDVIYTINNILADDWEFAEYDNVPILGGKLSMTYDQAKVYIERGIKMIRHGWKKGKHIKYDSKTNNASSITLTFEDTKAKDWDFFREETKDDKRPTLQDLQKILSQEV